MSDAQDLPVEFEPKEAEEVEVKLSPKLLKRKLALAEAKTYEQLGCKILKYKVRTLGLIGDYISKLGVKHIGHGTLVSANDNAAQQIEECDALVKELMGKDPPCDPEVIIAIKQLQRDFNRQLIDIGEAHLRADKLTMAENQGANIKIPFPAGQPMVVAIGKQPSKTDPPIENGEPAS